MVYCWTKPCYWGTATRELEKLQAQADEQEREHATDIAIQQVKEIRRLQKMCAKHKTDLDQLQKTHKTVEKKLLKQ